MRNPKRNNFIQKKYRSKLKYFLIVTSLLLTFGSSMSQSYFAKRALSKSETANSHFIPVDTSINPSQDTIPKIKKVTVGTILSEVILAPVFGALFAVPAGYISYEIIRP